MASLDPYRAKRDPTRTPEPVPAEDAAPRRRQRRALSFVIQEHHARALHWDLRLERDGVYASWAVPKGVPPAPGTNHLAVHVEDHPLEYGSFEGQIPQGEYGGGTVSIWDRGTYEADQWSERELKVTFHGSRLRGRYGLFHTDGDNWMIHRIDPAPPDWAPLPDGLEPMLAVSGTLPDQPGAWGYEFKWDGMRALVTCDGGRARAVSRNALDITASFPELRQLGAALGAYQAVLDGELIAFDATGRPTFDALQTRMHVADGARVQRRKDRAPASYMLFDLLHFDGHSTLDLPYAERRRLLESLDLTGDGFATPLWHEGPPATLLHAAEQSGLEGVVAKRLDSPYLPGRRSDLWVKSKLLTFQSVVIGGYTEGKEGRRGSIGALLLGLPEEGRLRYIGRVGSGLDEGELRSLQTQLGPLRAADSPFGATITAKEAAPATWVRPALVAEVRFTSWTAAGRLRHPVWRGLRPDLTPESVARER